jgi:hypothetical protein
LVGGLGCFKESLSYAIVRVYKNSQTLWQDMKNTRTEEEWLDRM